MRIRVPGERKTWRLLRLAAINLAIFLVAFEACIYLFPGAIPLEIVARFPLRQRAYFAKQQHMNVASIFTGDQYLYYLNATAAAGQKPFSIDSNGYRNPEAPAPGSRLDVVLLGDSLMIAEAAAKDLGQLFRDDGATACNLGMGGYSPLHYTLAYEKFIAQQGITPRNVVITLCLANDLVDLEQAIDIYYNKHLTYFEYTNQQVVIQKQHLWPLTPFVLRGIVRMAAAKIRKAPQERAQVEFTTPFGTGKLDHLRLATMGITYIQRLDTPLGDSLVDCLDRIINPADAAGAHCLLVIMPNWEGIYGSCVTGYDEAKARMEQDYATMRSFLETRLAGRCRVFDARPVLEDAARREQITNVVTDYHLNTRGVEVLHDAIRPLLDLGPVH